MAPEVIEGEIDKKSDVWLLGAILYTLITGK